MQRVCQKIRYRIIGRLVYNIHLIILHFVSNINISDVNVTSYSGARLFTILFQLDCTCVMLFNNIIYSKILKFLCIRKIPCLFLEKILCPHYEHHCIASVELLVTNFCLHDMDINVSPPSDRDTPMWLFILAYTAYDASKFHTSVIESSASSIRGTWMVSPTYMINHPKFS